MSPKNCFASIAVARCFDGTGREDASHLVDDQSCESFAFGVLGNNQQWLLGLADGFQDWNHLLVVADLFLEQQERSNHPAQRRLRLGW